MLRYKLIQRSSVSFVAGGVSTVDVRLIIWHYEQIVVEAVVEAQFLFLFSFIIYIMIMNSEAGLNWRDPLFLQLPFPISGALLKCPNRSRLRHPHECRSARKRRRQHGLLLLPRSWHRASYNVRLPRRTGDQRLPRLAHQMSAGDMRLQNRRSSTSTRTAPGARPNPSMSPTTATTNQDTTSTTGYTSSSIAHARHWVFRCRRQCCSLSTC